jgi:hypothetical protein
MSTPKQVPPADGSEISSLTGNELAHLLAGLECQKEELGPIADELIGLLHHLGVENPPRKSDSLKPSSE